MQDLLICWGVALYRNHLRPPPLFFLSVYSSSALVGLRVLWHYICESDISVNTSVCFFIFKVSSLLFMDVTLGWLFCVVGKWLLWGTRVIRVGPLCVQSCSQVCLHHGPQLWRAVFCWAGECLTFPLILPPTDTMTHWNTTLSSHKFTYMFTMENLYLPCVTE